MLVRSGMTWRNLLLVWADTRSYLRETNSTVNATIHTEKGFHLSACQGSLPVLLQDPKDGSVTTRGLQCHIGQFSCKAFCCHMDM